MFGEEDCKKFHESKKIVSYKFHIGEKPYISVFKKIFIRRHTRAKLYDTLLLGFHIEKKKALTKIIFIRANTKDISYGSIYQKESFIGCHCGEIL